MEKKLTIFHRLIQSFISNGAYDTANLPSISGDIMPPEIRKSLPEYKLNIKEMMEKSKSTKSSEYFNSLDSKAEKNDIRYNISMMPRVAEKSASDFKISQSDTLQILGCPEKDVSSNILYRIITWIQKTMKKGSELGDFKIVNIDAMKESNVVRVTFVSSTGKLDRSISLDFMLTVQSFIALNGVTDEHRDLQQKTASKAAEFQESLQLIIDEIAENNKKGKYSGNSVQAKDLLDCLNRLNSKFEFSLPDFLKICENFSPSSWFKFINSGESVARLTSVKDAFNEYIFIKSSFPDFNLPDIVGIDRNFKSDVLSTMMGAMSQKLRPQIYNVYSSMIKNQMQGIGIDTILQGIDDEALSKMVAAGDGSVRDDGLDSLNRNRYSESLNVLIEKAKASLDNVPKMETTPEFNFFVTSISKFASILLSSDKLFSLFSSLKDAIGTEEDTDVYKFDTDASDANKAGMKYVITKEFREDYLIPLFGSSGGNPTDHSVLQAQNSRYNLSHIPNLTFLNSAKLFGDLYATYNVPVLKVISDVASEATGEDITPPLLLTLTKINSEYKKKLKSSFDSVIGLKEDTTTSELISRMSNPDVRKRVMHAIIGEKESSKKYSTEELTQYVIDTAVSQGFNFKLPDASVINDMYTKLVKPTVTQFISGEKSQGGLVSIYTKLFELANSLGVVYYWGDALQGTAQYDLNKMFNFSLESDKVVDFSPTNSFYKILSSASNAEVTLMRSAISQFTSGKYAGSITYDPLARALYNSRIIGLNFANNGLVVKSDLQKILPVMPKLEVGDTEMSKTRTGDDPDLLLSEITKIVQSQVSDKESLDLIRPTLVGDLQGSIDYLESLSLDDIQGFKDDFYDGLREAIDSIVNSEVFSKAYSDLTKEEYKKGSLVIGGDVADQDNPIYSFIREKYLKSSSMPKGTSATTQLIFSILCNLCALVNVVNKYATVIHAMVSDPYDLDIVDLEDSIQEKKQKLSKDAYSALFKKLKSDLQAIVSTPTKLIDKYIPEDSMSPGKNEPLPEFRLTLDNVGFTNKDTAETFINFLFGSSQLVDDTEDESELGFAALKSYLQGLVLNKKLKPGSDITTYLDVNSLPPNVRKEFTSVHDKEDISEEEMAERVSKAIKGLQRDGLVMAKRSAQGDITDVTLTATVNKDNQLTPVRDLTSQKVSNLTRLVRDNNLQQEDKLDSALLNKYGITEKDYDFLIKLGLIERTRDGAILSARVVDGELVPDKQRLSGVKSKEFIHQSRARNGTLEPSELDSNSKQPKSILMDIILNLGLELGDILPVGELISQGLTEEGIKSLANISYLHLNDSKSVTITSAWGKNKKKIIPVKKEMISVLQKFKDFISFKKLTPDLITNPEELKSIGFTDYDLKFFKYYGYIESSIDTINDPANPNKQIKRELCKITSFIDQRGDLIPTSSKVEESLQSGVSFLVKRFENNPLAMKYLESLGL